MQKLTQLFLARRNYTPEKLQEINDQRHSKLKNIDYLCQILKQIHDQHQQIVIMPDFDTDGISAGTVGFSGLAQLGFNVALYIPNPANGYGINVSDIQNVQRQYPQAEYIITCDVGITCYEAFRYAYQHGLKVLVTDHHNEEKHKTLPNGQKTFSDHTPVVLQCETIVDPCQLSDGYSLKGICGAHVFYQILLNYCQLYDPQNFNLIDKLAVFAGIGTIGDMEPVIKENRLLIKETVNFLRALYNLTDLTNAFPANVVPVYRRSFIGLKTLLSEFAKNGKLYGGANGLDEKWLGWTLVPTYNSAKRLNLPMTLVFGIFFNTNPLAQKQCADRLIMANEDRKSRTKVYLAQIKDEIAQHQQSWEPFIYVTDANGGFLGLIANQLMRESGLPCFVINRNTLSGSGRAPAYFKILANLDNTEFQAKGHEEACGINFIDEMQINRFYDYLTKHAVPLAEKALAENKDKHDYDVLLASQGTSSANDDFIDLDREIAFYHDLVNLKPFGMGFAEPVIGAAINPHVSQISTMGSNHQHLKIVTPEGLELISWNNADKLTDLQNKNEFIFNGNLGLNHFRGQTKPQIIGDLA